MLAQSIDSDESLANQLIVDIKNTEQRKRATLLTSNVFDMVEQIHSQYERLSSRVEQSYPSSIIFQSKSQVVNQKMTGDTKDLGLYLNFSAKPSGVKVDRPLPADEFRPLRSQEDSLLKTSRLIDE